MTRTDAQPDPLKAIRRLDHQGLVVANYMVGPLEGEDGRSRVYGGRALGAAREVNVRIMRPEFQDFRASTGHTSNRYVHELRLASEAGGAACVRHLDAGTTAAGEHYLVRERLSGQVLRQVLAASERLDFPTAIGVVADVAGCVEKVHELGFVHVDLRPDNVEVTAREDGSLEARIIKLDLVVRAGDPPMHGGRPAFIGHGAFVAPEEAEGKPLAPTVDMYGLGALLYELTAGRKHLEVADRPEAVMDYLRGHGRLPSEKLRNLVRGLPDEADMLVAKCLKRQTPERPGSVEQLLRGLQHVLKMYQEANKQAVIPPGLWNRLTR